MCPRVTWKDSFLSQTRHFVSFLKQRRVNEAPLIKLIRWTETCLIGGSWSPSALMQRRYLTPYWLSDGCTSGSCSVTWLLSRCHPHMHTPPRTHTDPLRAWQTPGSPSLITVSRGGGGGVLPNSLVFVWDLISVIHRPSLGSRAGMGDAKSPLLRFNPTLPPVAAFVLSLFFPPAAVVGFHERGSGWSLAGGRTHIYCPTLIVASGLKLSVEGFCFFSQNEGVKLK